MNYENSEVSEKIGLSQQDEGTRSQILVDAIDLVKNDKESIRGAAKIICKQYGDKSLSYQYLGHVLKNKYDGTLGSLADKRGIKNGSRPRVDVSSPGWLYILGFKAAGQGTYTAGRKDLLKHREELEIPMSLIPTMQEIYYAKKNTPELFLPEYNKSRADAYDAMKMRTARAKLQPNDKMQGDEFERTMLTLDGNLKVEFHAFICADTATDCIRMPTFSDCKFNAKTMIQALKRALKPAPELCLPHPCCPKLFQIDNYKTHKCRSVLESERAFAEAMKIPFKIRYSLRKVPKSNAKAERMVSVVTQFIDAFINYIEIRAAKNPDVKRYREIMQLELLEFIKEWNKGKLHAQSMTRVQAYHRGCTPERTEFDPKLIDQCFREYREMTFSADQGIEIQKGVHLDSRNLSEFNEKKVFVALNPDDLEADAPAFFLKSKRAGLKFIGTLVHAEANPGLRNDKIGDLEKRIELASTANVVLALQYVTAKDARIESKYPPAESSIPEAGSPSSNPKEKRKNRTEKPKDHHETSPPPPPPEVPVRVTWTTDEVGS